MKKYILSIATVAALSITGSVLAAPITIDTFDDGGISYAVQNSSPTSASGTILSDGAIGGSRTNQTDHVDGPLGGNTGAFGSVFTYSSDAITRIKSEITWDKGGLGLGGVDLTQGETADRNYFSFDILEIDQGSVNLALTLTDTDGRVANISSNQMVVGFDQRIIFSNFLGADTFSFDSVDSINLSISQSSFASDFVFDSFVVDILPPAPLASTPIPAAIWLFGSGLVGLVGMSKRKKNQGLVA